MSSSTSQAQPSSSSSTTSRIKRFLKGAVQSSWSYPESRRAGEDPDRKIVEFRSRFYGPSDDSDCFDDKTQSLSTVVPSPSTASSKRRKTAFFRKTPLFRSRHLSHPVGSKDEGATEAALKLKRRTQHRRRECHLLQEMEWNHGLAIWTRRRDDWTGAVPVSEAFPNTDSEDESQASETVDESEIDDDEPIREAHPSPSLSRLLKRHSSNNHDSGGLTVLNHPTEGAPLYQSAPPPPRRHIPRHEHLPFVIPIRELIPESVAVRPKILPNALKSMYSSLIRDGRQPVYPIPLTSVLACCYEGWAESGEWPALTHSYREQQLQQERKKPKASATSSRSSFLRSVGQSAMPEVSTLSTTVSNLSTAGPPTPSALETIPISPVDARSQPPLDSAKPQPGSTSKLASNPALSSSRLPRLSGSPSTSPSTPTSTAPGDNATSKGTGQTGLHPSNSISTAASAWRRTKENLKLAASNTFSLRSPTNGNQVDNLGSVSTAGRNARSHSLSLAHSNHQAIENHQAGNSNSGADTSVRATTSADNTTLPSRPASASTPGPIATTTLNVPSILPSSLARKGSKKRREDGGVNRPKTVLFLTSTGITSTNSSSKSSSSKSQLPFSVNTGCAGSTGSGTSTSNSTNSKRKSALASMSVPVFSPLTSQASPLTPKAASLAAVEAAMEASSTNGGSATTETSPVETMVINTQNLADAKDIDVNSTPTAMTPSDALNPSIPASASFFLPGKDNSNGDLPRSRLAASSLPASTTTSTKDKGKTRADTLSDQIQDRLRLD